MTGGDIFSEGPGEVLVGKSVSLQLHSTNPDDYILAVG
jgi:hypothetical protein